jgi:hypothetical protein
MKQSNLWSLACRLSIIVAISAWVVFKMRTAGAYGNCCIAFAHVTL